MSNENPIQDWDDALSPEGRESVMDATRRAMGLPPRNGGFAAGVTDGRKEVPIDPGSITSTSPYGRTTIWRDGPNTSAVRKGKGV